VGNSRVVHELQKSPSLKINDGLLRKISLYQVCSATLATESPMTNEEFEHQTNTQSPQKDEVGSRQDAENCNEPEYRAKTIQTGKEAYSRTLGAMGETPPILGPAVDKETYRRALQSYKARLQTQAESRVATPVQSEEARDVIAKHKFNSRLAKLVLLALVAGGVWYYLSYDHANHNPHKDTPTHAGDRPQAVR
jgi:hypothetical protein